MSLIREKLTDILHLSSNISIDLDIDSSKEAFLPHFLDFIFYLFPVSNCPIKIEVASAKLLSIGYTSYVAGKLNMTTQINIFNSITLPSEIEIRTNTSDVLRISPMESFKHFHYKINNSSKIQTNSIESTLINSKSEYDYNPSWSKPGFINMLKAIKANSLEEMHTLKDAISLSEVIDKILLSYRD